MEYLKINTLNDKQTNLIISSQTANRLGLQKKKEVNVKFGVKVTEATIRIDNEISEGDIVISNRVLKKLSIPLECSYNIALKGNEVIIGPFIGVFLGKSEETVLKKLRIINSYLKNYSVLQGAIFAFSLEHINKEKLTMRGYLYNPIIDIWEEATLPYPSSIFVKATLNREWREYFGAVYGDSIFNYKPINKWEMFDRLKQFPNMMEFLPPTKIYSDVDDIHIFLNQHPNIYVKPIAGLKGMGIFNIEKKGSTFLVKARSESSNLEWDFQDIESFGSFVKDTIVPDKYIMQKTLDIQFGEKVIDFRVGLDKDQTGCWVNKMFVARVSGSSSIVSNRASGGQAGIPKELFQELFGMNENESDLLCKKIIKDTIDIADNLELTGFHYGKLVLDMSVDRNRNVWLIEINNKNPGNDLLLDLKEYRTYYEIRHTNMMYAKKLAGFNQENNNLVYTFYKNDRKSKPFKKKYRLLLSGTVQEVGLEEYAYKVAIDMGLTGLVKRTDDEKILLLEVEGNISDIYTFCSKLRSGTGESIIKSISLQEVTAIKSKKIFSIEDEIELLFTEEELNKSRISDNSPSSELNKLHSELNKLKEEHDKITRKYEQLQNSRTWRYTLPLRKIMMFVKK